VAGAKKNVGREKRNQKFYELQVREYRDRKQEFAAQGRKLHLKVTCWGGGSQLIETPHFSFLPSLAASRVAVFLFF
jgi:hypothetical protein